MANHIEITTTLPCINNCSYCPQGLLKESYGLKHLRLSLDDFKKALVNIPKDIQIHFSAFSEPFGNRESSQMMKYAYDQGYQVVLYTRLNGVTEEDKEILKDVKFTESYVHLIGIELPEVPWEYKTLKVDNPISRAGAIFDRESSNKLRCSRNEHFKQNVMLPNGDVYLCCMDYGLKHKIGNIFETDFNDMKREEGYELCRKCEAAC